MPSFRRITFVLLTAIVLVSCRRDKETVKKQYLESGNKYFDRARYKEAAIQYGNAIKIDPKFGPAHYKLGMVRITQKPADVLAAIREFHRSVELLEPNQAYQEEYKQSLVHLAEIYLILASKTTANMDEVQGWLDSLNKKDPNSFDVNRLNGDLEFSRIKVPNDGVPKAARLDKAMSFYRKAEALRPEDPGVTMQIGTVLLVQQKFAEAEPYFRKTILRNKSSYSAYMSLYTMYMSQSKMSEAEQVLKQAAQNNPNAAEYLERLAYHYGATGRRDDMVNVLQQIKSHAKDWDAVYQVVGDFYFRINDADSALHEYREGIQKDPSRKTNYQHSIIDVLMRQGKRAEAAEVNNQILKDNPKDPDAKSLSATFLLDQGDVTTALSQLRAVTLSSPDNATAHYQLGRALLATGKPDSREAARQEFERSISLRKDMITPRLGLAELQVLAGEYQSALDTTEAILGLDPNNVNAKLIQSQAYVGQKKFGESDALLNNISKANPSSPDVYYQIGTSFLTQGKPKEAESAFMRAYQLNPLNPKGLSGVVDAYVQQGKPQEAMSFLESESKKAPNRLDIQLLEGVTAQNQGDFNSALTHFNRVLSGLDKKAPVRADLYMQLGETYRKSGDRASAIANFQKAREIKPDNDVILSALGVLLDQADQKTEARKCYEASLRINANNPLVLNNLAFLMAETGSDLDVALTNAQKAKSLLPNLPEISDTYGWILLKKNLPEQAIPVFKDLIVKAPGSSTYHYHLAMAYNQKSETSKAADELREAMKHNPAKDEMQKITEMLSRLSGGR